MNFVASGNHLGRPFATPPGVPADRVAILRNVFAVTISDVEFLQHARRLNVDVAPVLGMEMQSHIEDKVYIDLRLAERAKPFLADYSPFKRPPAVGTAPQDRQKYLPIFCWTPCFRQSSSNIGCIRGSWSAYSIWSPPSLTLVAAPCGAPFAVPKALCMT